jgi:lipoprotein-anchoring transpeptidase ErfK/SrfK
MNTQPLPTNERLRQGVEAARAGREIEARAHLVAVLKQQPDNITAMLWLAFVLPAPQDSIRLLQRVLALDPTNDRAKAGIRWARLRLGLPAEESAPVQPAPEPPAEEPTLADSPEIGEDSIRAALLSNEVQQQAKKGAVAHRARRTINPFLGVILLAVALGLLAAGLGALVFVPTETMAAWMPVSTGVTLPQTNMPAAPTRLAAQATALLAQPMLKSFAFARDTLVMPTPPGHIYHPPVVSALASEPEVIPATPAPVVKKIASTQLVGPMGPFKAINPATSTFTTGRLQLAHQPAYPGEKWIEVNVTTQQLTAWEGDKPVMSYAVSTGLPNTPTVLGEFNIYEKLTATLMTGSDYYLPDVPYTMYFYGGYALHGTYWHHNFGQPMSHGCVNLETENARKLFEWATPLIPPGQTYAFASADNPGTLVVVHE